ncbi:MAG TPA: hypothetical protein VEI82_04610, partial [Myxococcota bacterium]|nr:hypothetical protein [Myxococcota bacterium]
MSDPPRPALAALAERLGIFASYYDIAGTHRVTSDATREALCTAMGVACASEAEARLRLDELAGREAARRIAPVQLLRAGEAARLGVRAPASERPREAQLELTLEDGARSRVALELPAGDGTASAELPLPVPLPPGVHQLSLELPGPGAGERARQILVVAPASAWRADEALGAQRALGVWTNL